MNNEHSKIKLDPRMGVAQLPLAGVGAYSRRHRDVLDGCAGLCRAMGRLGDVGMTGRTALTSHTGDPPMTTRATAMAVAAVMAMKADPLMGWTQEARDAWSRPRKPSGKNRDTVKAARKQNRKKETRP